MMKKTFVFLSLFVSTLIIACGQSQSVSTDNMEVTEAAEGISEASNAEDLTEVISDNEVNYDKSVTEYKNGWDAESQTLTLLAEGPGTDSGPFSSGLDQDIPAGKYSISIIEGKGIIDSSQGRINKTSLTNISEEESSFLACFGDWIKIKSSPNSERFIVVMQYDYSIPEYFSSLVPQVNESDSFEISVEQLRERGEDVYYGAEFQPGIYDVELVNGQGWIEWRQYGEGEGTVSSEQHYFEAGETGNVIGEKQIMALNPYATMKFIGTPTDDLMPTTEDFKLRFVLR